MPSKCIRQLLTVSAHLLAKALICFALASNGQAANGKGHLLRFNGVSVSQGRLIQGRFPHVFERGVTLAEVDDVVRYLMKTGLYANVDVFNRNGESDDLLLVATPLRRIKSIAIVGDRAMAAREVKQILAIEEGKIFERKELIESVKLLQAEYRKRGYRTMNAEIEFETPSESDVALKIRIDEGGPTIVDRIQIETPNPELNSKLDRIVKPLRGKALSEDDLNNAVREMTDVLKGNRYLTARILEPQPVFDEKQEKVRLAIAVENPWSYQFRFNGNVEMSESSLIGSLNLDQLLGTVTTPAPELAERLRKFYHSKGYAHIDIRATEKNFESRFSREITFDIDEGPRVRLKRIDITGNISRPGTYYANFIESTASDLLGEGYYNRRDIEDGIKRLEIELQNQGYLRAKVKSWRSEFISPPTAQKVADRKRGSQATVILNVDEGPLTIVRQIRFEGADSFSKIQLQNLLPIHTNQSLRIKDLSEAIEKLKAFYYSQGFIEMKVLNEQEGLVSYNESSTQATVEFQIVEGPKVTVSSIVIEGNTFTQEHVIARELSLKKGDVYNFEKRDDCLYHLQRLNLFSKVAIRTLEEGTSISDRTVIVEVEEALPGTFESGAGVLLDQFPIFRGFVGVGYRNLYGTGRAVSLRADPSYSTNEKISYLEHKVTLSYIEPYILRDRNKGRIDLTREISFATFEGPTTVMRETNSLSLQVLRDFDRNTKLTFTAYRLSSELLFDRWNYQSLETRNIAKTGPLIEFDYRDNIFYPTKGSYTALSLEYSDPFLGSSEDSTQSIKFAKLSGSYSYPYRINDSPFWIFATNVRAGYLVNLSQDPNGGVPYQEAFFLGGRSTIRGFQPTNDSDDRDRIPNLFQLGKAKLRDFQVTSDSWYYLIKAEIRFPIWRNAPWGDTRGAIFYDGGAVLLSQTDLVDPYRHAAGPALRLIFPGGIALSFEWGWKLNRRAWGGAQENENAFHMSIGTF